MKPLLVVNPNAGKGAAGRTFGAIRGTIERALGDVDVVLTERASHASEIAEDAANEGRTLVVAVGGDGTTHEVVNGLMRARERDPAAFHTQLGIIAQGTGGDFPKTLGLTHRLDHYLAAITSKRERAIDVGRFSRGTTGDTHYFVNILSAGMGGLVDRYVAEGSRIFGGKAAYFGASLKALVNARLGHVLCTITRNGKAEEHKLRSFMIAVCNGRYFGGGMHVAPMATIDDGQFDLVALGATSKVAFALTSSGIYNGTHIQRPETVVLRGEKIELRLANDDARDVFLLDVDGESMGSLPVTIEVVPKALVLRG